MWSGQSVLCPYYTCNNANLQYRLDDCESCRRAREQGVRLIVLATLTWIHCDTGGMTMLDPALGKRETHWSVFQKFRSSMQLSGAGSFRSLLQQTSSTSIYKHSFSTLLAVFRLSIRGLSPTRLHSQRLRSSELGGESDGDTASACETAALVAVRTTVVARQQLLFGSW